MPISAARPATIRHQRIVDVHMLLIDNGQVLLTLRQGTGYADGQWQVPSGHLEDQEHTAEGAAREAAEEIDSWTGTPVNNEPHKCGGIDWFPLNQVPANTVAYHAAAIANVTAGRIHSVFGWDA